MPKLRVQRFYYRNGRIHTEIRELDGQLHGPYRTWHFNGQMAEELHYHHGLLHGTSRYWDEKGRLLGSFTMKHGTGCMRNWHDNGRLRWEVDCVEGKFTGRNRGWLQDGTLVQETYHINYGNVSRAVYLKAARRHADWPQYKGQRAGKVIRPSLTLERKRHELFIASILKKSHTEAREWLSAAKHPKQRSLAKFRTARAALRFVETIYAVGAEAVIVAPIYPGGRGRLFADWLLIKLPRMPSKRRAVRKLCQDFCHRRGGALLPEKDFGESHLFMRLW
jgi:antitoxin component YwqK of YwqJK toxin-antitoxin module